MRTKQGSQPRHRRFIVILLSLMWLWCLSCDKSTGSVESSDLGGLRGVDRAIALGLDSTGNVYVTGYSYSSESHYDFATLKYDRDGRVVWIARYDGPASLSDYAAALAVDPSGNVYVAGHSNGVETSLDLTVVKYDREGREVWIARYDGPGKRDDYAQALAVGPDGHLYVTGYSFGQGTEHDFVTLKYNPNGDRLWAARYNPPRNRDDSAIAIGLDASGAVYVTGTDRVRGSAYDFATLKYDAQGRLVWLSRFSGEDDVFDYAQAQAIDSDGNVYVTGFSYDADRAYDYVTVKYDENGEKMWTARHNGSADGIDSATAVAVDEKGNTYVTGKSFGEDSGFDYCTLKYDNDGQQVWIVNYSGRGNGADVPSCVALDPDFNIIVTGFSRGERTERDFATLKYDPQGELLWDSRYDGECNGDDVPKAMAVDAEGNVYVAGYSYTRKTGYDFLTIKHNPQGKKVWIARYTGEKE